MARKDRKTVTTELYSLLISQCDQGATTPAIARSLGLSEKKVRCHIANYLEGKTFKPAKDKFHETMIQKARAA